jgi:hypothetical protein
MFARHRGAKDIDRSFELSDAAGAITARSVNNPSTLVAANPRRMSLERHA